MFPNQVVVVGAFEVVGDATFIRLNVATRLTFLAEEDNKTRTNDVSLNFFIKNK
jgi:hypothetical protein